MTSSEMKRRIERLRSCDTPIVFNARNVAKGNLVHVGRHGPVCIPADVLLRLTDGLDRLFAAEAVVSEQIMNGPVDFETFKDLWTGFEKART